MSGLLSLVVMVLVTCGVRLLLERRLLPVLLGVALVSHAANLVIFVAGGVARGGPAFVGPDGVVEAGRADPVPQALILTAIVISFGVMAFALALAFRAYRVLGNDDLPTWRESEPPIEMPEKHGPVKPEEREVRSEVHPQGPPHVPEAERAP